MAKPIWKQINLKLILSTTCSFLTTIFRYSRDISDILKPNTCILFLMFHTKHEHLPGTTPTTEKMNASFVVSFPSLKAKSTSQQGKHLGISPALISCLFIKTILSLTCSFKVTHTKAARTARARGSPGGRHRTGLTSSPFMQRMIFTLCPRRPVS